MSVETITFHNGPLFDGTSLIEGQALCFEDNEAVLIVPEARIPPGSERIDLNGDILSPGYVDLQVNGGGGVLLNDDPSLDTMRRIASAHRGLGVRALLPTLITDTVELTRSAVAAAKQAVADSVPGIAGLHLEGPHLSLARKGAHDPALIRPMEESDLEMLLEAAAHLPVLKITIAPESVMEKQVARLAKAGVVISLGHSAADFDTCRRYFAAGARCATHLFNAMSQLGNREPGLVGAALATPSVAAGLIADAVHVHPEAMRCALAAKRGPGRIFLVSDAMAVAGTDMRKFSLNGRAITRRDNILTLEDGTLAGADLDLTTAIRVITGKVGLDLTAALQMATSVPAALIGLDAGSGPWPVSLDQTVRIASDLTGVRFAMNCDQT